MTIDNKIIFASASFVLGIIILIVVIKVIITKRENLFTGAPQSLIYRGPYRGSWGGIGTPIWQTNWSGGQMWQPWVPLNTGLYGYSDCKYC